MKIETVGTASVGAASAANSFPQTQTKTQSRLKPLLQPLLQVAPIVVAPAPASAQQ